MGGTQRRYTIDVYSCNHANKKPKINQTVVAREAGMTQPQVSNYLSGKVWPSAQSLIRLAAALGVEPDVLAMMLARKRVSRLAKG